MKNDGNLGPWKQVARFIVRDHTKVEKAVSLLAEADPDLEFRIINMDDPMVALAHWTPDGWKPAH